MRLFLTGDRAMHPELALVIASGVLAREAVLANQADEKIELIGTGDNDGFESGVRSLCSTLGIACQVVQTGVNPDTSKPAWDTRHELVDAGFEKVVMAHSDPLASSIGSSAMKVLGDKLDIVTL